MHIYISAPWWTLPIAAIASGLLGAMFLTPRDQGPYDFLPGFITLGWLVGGFVLAVGLLVGHYA